MAEVSTEREQQELFSAPGGQTLERNSARIQPRAWANGCEIWGNKPLQIRQDPVVYLQPGTPSDKTMHISLLPPQRRDDVAQ